MSECRVSLRAKKRSAEYWSRNQSFEPRSDEEEKRLSENLIKYLNNK